MKFTLSTLLTLTVLTGSTLAAPVLEYEPTGISAREVEGFLYPRKVKPGLYVRVSSSAQCSPRPNPSSCHSQTYIRDVTEANCAIMSGIGWIAQGDSMCIFPDRRETSTARGTCHQAPPKSSGDREKEGKKSIFNFGKNPKKK